MPKLHASRTIEKNQGIPFALPEQVEVPLHQLAGAVKEGLLAFSVGVGLQVMQLMMDEELNAVVGPTGKHNSDRTATRHGSDGGSVKAEKPFLSQGGDWLGGGSRVVCRQSVEGRLKNPRRPRHPPE